MLGVILITSFSSSVSPPQNRHVAILGYSQTQLLQGFQSYCFRVGMSKVALGKPLSLSGDSPILGGVHCFRAKPIALKKASESTALLEPRRNGFVPKVSHKKSRFGCRACKSSKVKVMPYKSSRDSPLADRKP